MTPAFVLERATVRRGRALVLRDVSVQARAGELLGVIGANGAGKTTLLRAALGLARLEQGRAVLGGRDVKTLSDPQRAALAAYLPQERRIGWNLPAWRASARRISLQPPRASGRMRPWRASGWRRWPIAACWTCRAASAGGCCWRACWPPMGRC
jgi:iron complex transport system ATP-binding protein